MEGRFTEEELGIAKSVDLCLVAKELGYTVKRVGNYHTLTEMDSVRIYNRTNWYRWSRAGEKGHNGGSQIDFLKEFAGMDVKEAVFWLLDFAGYRKDGIGAGDKGLMDRKIIVSGETKTPGHEPFFLPGQASNNLRITEYLTKKRCISESTVKQFTDLGLVYESDRYHNVVFVGTDAGGRARFASMRGIYDSEKSAFKCDVKGSDKRYGFHLKKDGAEAVAVFEGAIDLMSYADIYHDTGEDLLALGMLSDSPLEQYLNDHPEIRSIRLCLDNDEPGRKASVRLKDKYISKGYRVSIDGPPAQYKDYNEWLVAAKTRNGAMMGTKSKNGASLGHRI